MGGGGGQLARLRTVSAREGAEGAAAVAGMEARVAAQREVEAAVTADRGRAVRALQVRTDEV